MRCCIYILGLKGAALYWQDNVRDLSRSSLLICGPAEKNIKADSRKYFL